VCVLFHVVLIAPLIANHFHILLMDIGVNGMLHGLLLAAFANN